MSQEDAHGSVGGNGAVGTGGGSGGHAGFMNPAVAELRAALANEKCSPELLQRVAVVDTLAEALAEQQQVVNEMTSGVGVSGGGALSALGGMGVAGSGGGTSAIAISLYQQDIERVRYLAAAYARVRLRKIEQQHFYIWHADDVKSRLSDAERAFLERIVTARAAHYMGSVISQLPARAGADATESLLRAMDESQRPALKTHVFVAVHETVEGLVPDDAPDEEPIDLVAGRDVLVQYALVRQALLERKVQLR